MEIDISNDTHPNAVMLIDESDYEYLISIGVDRIHPTQPRKRGAIYAMCRVGGIHKAIHNMLLPDAKMVDHKNHNGLDNRRGNIRPTNPRKNQSNRVCQGTSDYVGVYLSKGKYWVAQIKTNGVQVYLGSFKNEIDASDRYQEELRKILQKTGG